MKKMRLKKKKKNKTARLVHKSDENTNWWLKRWWFKVKTLDDDVKGEDFIRH